MHDGNNAHTPQGGDSRENSGTFGEQRRSENQGTTGYQDSGKKGGEARNENRSDSEHSVNDSANSGNSK